MAKRDDDGRMGCHACHRTGKLGSVEEEQVECPRCGGAGTVELVSDSDLSTQKARGEATGRLLTWLYATDELVELLSGQGVTWEKLDAIRNQMEAAHQEPAAKDIAAAIHETLAACARYAQFIDTWRRSPTPSERARSLRAKAKELRAAAEIIRQAEACELFVPSSLDPRRYASEPRWRPAYVRHMPSAVALRVRNPSTARYLDRLADDLEAHANDIANIAPKLALRQEKGMLVFYLLNSWLLGAGGDWGTLEVGETENYISPPLTFLCKAVSLVESTPSGHPVEPIAGPTLRRYAYEARKFALHVFDDVGDGNYWIVPHDIIEYLERNFDELPSHTAPDPHS